MLLYIHVPFCQSRCAYCAFHSVPLAQAGATAMQDWVRGISREITYWGDKLGHPKLSTVFFGGGTPSLLPEKIVANILLRLNKAFGLEKGAEITLEGNPDSAGEAGYLYEIYKAGINRLSLGVQSLDDAMLQMLGRTHSSRHVVNTVMVARQAGFTNLSLDLIWGLPGQRPQAWLNSLKEIIRLKPEHLSCYGLTLEPGTKLHELLEKGKLDLPPEREQALMFMNGAEYLEELGYIHYEISNFARMGFQCRHNMGYWEGEDYLGLGPAASSTVDGLRWTNPTDLNAWYNGVDDGKFAFQAEILDSNTRLSEMVMLRLRTAKGLPLKDYQELSGRNFMQEHQNIIDALHKRKLLRIKNGHVSLTNNGMLLSNSIIEALMP